MIEDAHDQWQQQLEIFRESLDKVVQDMMTRLEGGEHNIIAGVSAFVCNYQQMMKTTPAPNAGIAYALNNFGKVDSK